MLTRDWSHSKSTVNPVGDQMAMVVERLHLDSDGSSCFCQCIPTSRYDLRLGQAQTNVHIFVKFPRRSRRSHPAFLRHSVFVRRLLVNVLDRQNAPGILVYDTSWTSCSRRNADSFSHCMTQLLSRTRVLALIGVHVSPILGSIHVPICN